MQLITLHGMEEPKLPLGVGPMPIRNCMNAALCPRGASGIVEEGEGHSEHMEPSDKEKEWKGKRQGSRPSGKVSRVHCNLRVSCTYSGNAAIKCITSFFEPLVGSRAAAPAWQRKKRDGPLILTWKTVFVKTTLGLVIWGCTNFSVIIPLLLKASLFFCVRRHSKRSRRYRHPGRQH